MICIKKEKDNIIHTLASVVIVMKVLLSWQGDTQKQSEKKAIYF